MPISRKPFFSKIKHTNKTESFPEDLEGRNWKEIHPKIHKDSLKFLM